MRPFWLSILATVAIGCTQTSGTHQTPTASVTLDEAQVLAIAREAICTNDTWIDRAEFETPKRQPDGSWTVGVWRRPATPGGDRLIRIDSDGKVRDYFRGY